MGKPLLYDGFSGAGGAAKGYMDAGFRVIGIDNKKLFHSQLCLKFLDTSKKFTNSVVLIMTPFERKFKILRRIVVFITILMMYFFERLQVSTKFLGHNQPVLKYSPSFVSHCKVCAAWFKNYLDISRTTLMPTAFPVWVTFLCVVALNRGYFASTTCATQGLGFAFLEHYPIFLIAIWTCIPHPFFVNTPKPQFFARFDFSAICHVCIIRHREADINA